MVKLQNLKRFPIPAWYAMTVFCFILSICGIITISIIWYFANQLIYSYGIIIDAGSTSTKVYLYKWPEIASRTNGEVSQVKMCRSDPGISDYMTNPNNSIFGIKNCIKDVSSEIPRRLRTKTFVYLGATAGMRLVEQRNFTAVKLIFEAIERYLLTTGYKMKNLLADVKVISGQIEGISAWITVNYLKGTLQQDILGKVFPKKIKKTFGALDLGGASTQITFVPDPNIEKTNLKPIRLYGSDYNVYSHSYLCYGKSQAEIRLLGILIQKWLQSYDPAVSTPVVENPCMLNGDAFNYTLDQIVSIPCVSGSYAKDNFGFSIELPESLRNKSMNITFSGSGNPDKCQIFVKRLFDVSKCSYSSCGFNNVYQPNLTDKFLAFSGYNLIYQHLPKQLGTTVGYDDFLSQTKTYCKQNAPINLTVEDKEKDTYRKWRCFSFFYVFQLLTSMGFNRLNWDSIIFTDSVKNANLGWSLGYMIEKTSMIPIEKPFVTISVGTFTAILLTCLVLLSFGCLFAIISFKLHRFTKHDSKPTENENLKFNLKDNYYDELSNQA